jgi:hypothetical protein
MIIIRVSLSIDKYFVAASFRGRRPIKPEPDCLDILSKASGIGKSGVTADHDVAAPPAAIHDADRGRISIAWLYGRPPSERIKCSSKRRPLFSNTIIVIPAKAGTHFSTSTAADGWVPAFAGMTT